MQSPTNRRYFPRHCDLAAYPKAPTARGRRERARSGVPERRFPVTCNRNGDRSLARMPLDHSRGTGAIG